MRQPMKVRFAIRSIRPLWRNWVEGPKDVEEWGAERRRPRNRVDAVGDGVADPSKSSKALLDVGWCLRRTDGSQAAPDSLRALRKVDLVPLTGNKPALPQTATKLIAGVDMMSGMTKRGRAGPGKPEGSTRKRVTTL